MTSVSQFDREVVIARSLSRALQAPPAEFRLVFEKLRGAYPSETAHYLIGYIARRGLDEVSKRVLPWLCREQNYLDQLFDPAQLSVQAARTALEAFRAFDPQFSLKFAERLAPNRQGVTPAILQRSLELLVGLSTYESFIPQLQSLTRHPDLHVRSKAVKALCQARPNKSLIDRHAHSEDARVRANAVEALWRNKTEDARAAFEVAVKDPDHRTALNAVVGLYYMDDPRAVQMLENMAGHPEAPFRRATVWALDLLADARTRPFLEKLVADPSPIIQANAQRALAKLPVDEVAPLLESTPSPSVDPAKEPEHMSEAPPVDPIPGQPTFAPNFKLL
jgi:HEAT repeat protein